MAKHDTAAHLIDPKASLGGLRDAAGHCTACDLYKHATQTVFGEGPAGAPMILVGETPGDVEDKTGRPFVGPAGRLLDRALADAGIDRKRVYVTNAVKHFKYVMRGKKRLHQKPHMIEVEICRPWLLAEIDRIAPAVVVCLGATAAQSLLGRAFRVTKQRGKVFTSEFAKKIVATVHPSALLRVPDPETRRIEYRRFVADLRAAGKLAGFRARKRPAAAPRGKRQAKRG
jgi:DNA polymerase